MSSDQLTSSEQTSIWKHFQTTGVSAFDGSQPRSDFIRSLVAGSNQRILIIGYGSGYLDARLRSDGHEVVSLDPVAAALSGVSGLCAGIQSLPLRSGVCDVVIASEVLEHLDDDVLTAGLTEVHRVLGPSGRFIGSVPFGEDLAASTAVCPNCSKQFHRWGHVRSFDQDSLRSTISGFASVVSSPTVFKSLHEPMLGRAVIALRLVKLWRTRYPVTNSTLVFAASKTTSDLSFVSRSTRLRRVLGHTLRSS